MIRRFLRELANKQAAMVIAAWVLLVICLRLMAPAWEQIALEGDLEHLPPTAPSVQAAHLLRDAFPQARAKSEMVLAFARASDALSVQDRQFILDLAFAVQELPDLPVVDVWHTKTPVVNRMLLSPDERCEMVVVRLSTPLMAVDNIRVRDQLLAFVEDRLQAAPAGLTFGLTGSAAIGGDTLAAARDGLRATHVMTILLVLICLLLIYRSPLLVLAPIVTIFCSVAVAMGVVALLVEATGAESGLRVFTTTKVFVVVILFGAGTDFCLFLIARYREELTRGVSPQRAPGIALRNVSGALAGSAFTTILGLATMALAQYGKFASSGPVIAICLFVALLACTTLTPAILRIIGPSIFWPFGVGSDQAEREGWEHRLWGRLSEVVLRRPGLVLCTGALLAAAPMLIGFNAPVNYDLLSELPSSSPSIRGARLIREHFGEGWLSPMTLAVRLPGAHLDNADARFDVALLHNALFQLPEVHDVRSPYLPTGGDPTRRRHFSYEGIYNAATTGSPLTIQSFVSKSPGLEGEVMQLYLVQEDDPFSQAAREAVPRIRLALNSISSSATLDGQPNPWRGADFQLAGATAGMIDLKRITQSDNNRIQIACVIAVLLVLLALLRRPLVCLYLMMTVLATYWVTLGITHVVFQAVYGPTYHGLDWKAPLFLFVILVAVGQDYNIYLTTRVLEEQRRHGMREGLRRAIIQTGGIITSCGVIMAGTFISMTFGELRGMVELGFALSLGVLLDTFVVRTIIVPCYFALQARDKDSDPKQPHPLKATAASL